MLGQTAESPPQEKTGSAHEYQASQLHITTHRWLQTKKTELSSIQGNIRVRAMPFFLACKTNIVIDKIYSSSVFGESYFSVDISLRFFFIKQQRNSPNTSTRSVEKETLRLSDT